MMLVAKQKMLRLLFLLAVMIKLLGMLVGAANAKKSS